MKLSDVGAVKVEGEPHCPECNAKLDGARVMSDPEPKTPTEGDFSLCIYCGCIGRFKEGKIVKAEGHELIDHLDPFDALVVLDIQQKVRAYRAKQKEKE